MTQSDIQSGSDGSDHFLVTGYGSNGYVVTGYWYMEPMGMYLMYPLAREDAEFGDDEHPVDSWLTTQNSGVNVS